MYDDGATLVAAIKLTVFIGHKCSLIPKVSPCPNKNKMERESLVLIHPWYHGITSLHYYIHNLKCYSCKDCKLWSTLRSGVCYYSLFSCIAALEDITLYIYLCCIQCTSTFQKINRVSVFGRKVHNVQQLNIATKTPLLLHCFTISAYNLSPRQHKNVAHNFL